MMDKPLVSVVMPVYKVEKYLKEAAESVVNQTYENIELILVDDGSPDNSPEICDELEEKYENVKSFHKPNGGLSDARNFGIGKASGKYVFFLDSDDTICPDAIVQMVKVAENENADVVIPDRYYKVFEGNNNKELCFMFRGEDAYISDPRDFALDIIIAGGSAWRATAVLYKTSVIDEKGCSFPVGHTSEDVVFNLQFMSYAKKCSFVRRPVLNYLKRKGSITTSFNKNFFKTIMFIDEQVSAFFDRNNIVTEENKKRQNTLLCRNAMVYLFSLYRKSNGLNKDERKKICNEVMSNERVTESMNADIYTPYFNRKEIGILMVILHDLVRFKLKWLAMLIIKAIGSMR